MTLPFIILADRHVVGPCSIGIGLLRLHGRNPICTVADVVKGAVDEAAVMLSRHYVLAAGGTGGHMIPAHALAEELMRRGHRVALVADDRGARIPGLFEGVQVHILPAGRLGGGPLGWLSAIRKIFTGRAMASRLYETFEPSAVIGFGGYPALPALMAAQRDRIRP